MEQFIAKTGFDRRYGFIHPISVEKLADNRLVEAIFEDLPGFVSHGGLHEALSSMAPFVVTMPTDAASLRRLFMMLAFIAHVFVRGGKDEPQASYIPECLSEPLINAATILGVQPIVSYASTTQFNVAVFSQNTRDEDIPVIGAASGLEDERWFYKCSLFIERMAPRFIGTWFEAVEAIQSGDKVRAIRKLEELAQVTETFQPKLARIRERCDPIKFYSIIRRYLAGWRNDPSLPNGVDYEGYGRRLYFGGTAGQSPFVQLVDIALGIHHEGSFQGFMFDCMPLLDRQALNYFMKQPSLSDVISESGSKDLYKQQYNRIINSVYRFRDEHLIVVTQYIIKPAILLDGSSIGTGGSNPLQLLTQYKRNTMAALIE